MHAPAKDTPAIYRLIYVGRSSARIERDFGARLERLIHEGFEVHLLCGDDGSIPDLVARGVIVKPIPVLDARNLAGLLGAYFIVQAYFIEQEPVLVHAMDGAVATLGVLAAAAANVDVVVLSAGEHDFEKGRVKKGLEALSAQFDAHAPRLLRDRVRAKLPHLLDLKGLSAARFLALLVDKYLVSNEYDLQMLQELEIVPSAKLETLIGGDGVDLTEFDVNDAHFPTPDAAREALGLPRAWRNILGYRGALTSAEECDDLRECIVQIARSHPTTGWFLDLNTDALGGLSERRALLRLKAQLRREQVRLFEDAPPVGARFQSEDASFEEATFYRALDLFVSPRRTQGGVRALQEAAATEVGALAYHLADSAAAIEHGQTGELVDCGDIDGLIMAIRAALDDPARRQSWAKRARALAMRRFNRQHIEDQIFRIYDTILETKLNF